MGSIVDSIAGFFGHGAQKKQTKLIIGDYQGAEDGSIAAAGTARDAAVAAYQPFYNTGGNALARADQMQQGGFQYSPTDPSYKWRFDQGMNALNSQHAAAGSLNSGGAQKAAMRYGQGLASTEFANDFSRNNLLAGYGMQSAGGIAAANSLWGQNVGNALFKSADGMSGARSDRGEAIASQWADGANLVKGIGSLFSGGF